MFKTDFSFLIRSPWVSKQKITQNNDGRPGRKECGSEEVFVEKEMASLRE